MPYDLRPRKEHQKQKNDPDDFIDDGTDSDDSGEEIREEDDHDFSIQMFQDFLESLQEQTEGEEQEDAEEVQNSLLEQIPLLKQVMELSSEEKMQLSALIEEMNQDEPSIQRVLQLNVPKDIQMQMMEQVFLYITTPMMSTERKMLRKALQEQLKLWENVDEEERAFYGKVLKDSTTPTIHTVRDLKAPDEVKGSILRMMTEEDKDPSHKRRVQLALKIPYEKVRPIPDIFSAIRTVKTHMDQYICGMEKVKMELLQAINLKFLQPRSFSAILLHGPSGVGKTHLAQIFAESLGLYFDRISLGGANDAHLLLGSESVYHGSTVGRLTQILIRAESKNPVVLLDEIDKTGTRKDKEVENALLHILDPTMNDSIRDTFLPEVPMDLSHVFFLATANDISTISTPLRSRMRVVEVPAYSAQDLVRIVQTQLISRMETKFQVQLKLDESNIRSFITARRSTIEQQGVRFVESALEQLVGKEVLHKTLNRDTSQEPMRILLDTSSESTYTYFS